MEVWDFEPESEQEKEGVVLFVQEEETVPDSEEVAENDKLEVDVAEEESVSVLDSVGENEVDDEWE